nr:hypothetical protein [Tanacetum cinerariifolium]
MLLSPQHAGFGDQQEMLMIISLKIVDHTCLKDLTMLIFKADSRQGIFDSGCSKHMTGNKSFFTDYQELEDGFVAFGGSPKGGKDYAQNVKKSVKNWAISTQDWKSTAKAGSTGIFHKQSSQEA